VLVQYLVAGIRGKHRARALGLLVVLSLLWTMSVAAARLNYQARQESQRHAQVPCPGERPAGPGLSPAG
jgi:hypothetical protein